jgi:uncharacterized protein with GYD domain
VNAAFLGGDPQRIAKGATRACNDTRAHGKRLHDAKDAGICVLYWRPPPGRTLRPDAQSKEPAVSLYVMLSTLSESGRKVLRERPGWIRKVNADVERMGARVVAQWAVLGPYDFVTVIDAPDNASISRISVELGARGSVQMMTMAAIPLDEFIQRLERGDAGKRRERKKR